MLQNFKSNHHCGILCRKKCTVAVFSGVVFVVIFCFVKQKFNIYTQPTSNDDDDERT